MSACVGKTIARIETGPTSPDSSYRADDTILIHFTDGTALNISGSSHEEVWLDHAGMTRDEVMRWQRAAQGRREAERQERLNHAGWLALSCDERAAHPRNQRPPDPFGLVVGDWLYEDFAVWYGRGTVRKRCENCGERECPNARVVPHERRGLTHIAGDVTISAQLLGDGQA